MQRKRATIVPPDRRVIALGAPATRRSQAAQARAKTALRALDARGEPITFQAVAHAAGVSRQWLYTQPELRDEIEQLRAADSNAEDRLVPARDRARERGRARGRPGGVGGCKRRGAGGRPGCPAAIAEAALHGPAGEFVLRTE